MHVLSIAGWAQSRKALSPLATTLSDTCEVTETSVHALDSGSTSYAENLAKAIRSMPQSPVVIGWSMGGIVALEAISHHGATPGALILISSTARFCSADDYPCGVPPRSLKAMKLGLKKAPDKTLKTFFKALSMPNGVDEAALAEYTSKALEVGAPALDRGLDYLVGTDLRDTLPGIDVPTLVIHGELDTIIPFGASEYLANSLPQGRLSLDARWGHDLPIRGATLVSKMISEFLEEQS